MKDLPVVYRGRGLKSGMIVIALLIPAFGLPDTLTNGSGPLSVGLQIAGMAAASAYCGCRLARTGAFAFDRELVIVNPLRTIRLQWEAIDHFTYGRFGLIRKVGAKLKTGEVIPIYGLMVSAAGLGGSVKDAFEELNERVDHHSSL